MKKLLILVLGVFVAGAAAYAIPKDVGKMDLKPFIEVVAPQAIFAIAEQQEIVVTDFDFSPGDVMRYEEVILNPITIYLAVEPERADRRSPNTLARRLQEHSRVNFMLKRAREGVRC